MGDDVYAYPGLRTGLGTPTTEGAGHGRRKPVTRVSTIGASQARIQRKVLVAIGAVAATIPIVAFQQAPVSRQSRVPRVGHVREQPQHQRERQ